MRESLIHPIQLHTAPQNCKVWFKRLWPARYAPAATAMPDSKRSRTSVSMSKIAVMKTDSAMRHPLIGKHKFVCGKILARLREDAGLAIGPNWCSSPGGCEIQSPEAALWAAADSQTGTGSLSSRADPNAGERKGDGDSRAVRRRSLPLEASGGHVLCNKECKL